MKNIKEAILNNNTFENHKSNLLGGTFYLENIEHLELKEININESITLAFN